MSLIISVFTFLIVLFAVLSVLVFVGKLIHPILRRIDSMPVARSDKPWER